eukprot:COSAG01_NODE_6278_length_3758_cov_6.618748_1_plen_47_part_00
MCIAAGDAGASRRRVCSLDEDGKLVGRTAVHVICRCSDSSASKLSR